MMQPERFVPDPTTRTPHASDWLTEWTNPRLYAFIHLDELRSRIQRVTGMETAMQRTNFPFPIDKADIEARTRYHVQLTTHVSNAGKLHLAL